MAKTGKEIQDDFYRMLVGSTLAGAVSGRVYKNGYRPRDSKAEDIIVIFTTGLADQIQSGVVTLNIYVPDVAPYDNGVLVEDGVRTMAIERAAADWVTANAGSTNYRLRLQRAITTDYEESIQQHFVVVQLRYDYFDE